MPTNAKRSSSRLQEKQEDLKTFMCDHGHVGAMERLNIGHTGPCGECESSNAQIYYKCQTCEEENEEGSDIVCKNCVRKESLVNAKNIVRESLNVGAKAAKNLVRESLNVGAKVAAAVAEKVGLTTAAKETVTEDVDADAGIRNVEEDKEEEEGKAETETEEKAQKETEKTEKKSAGETVKESEETEEEVPKRPSIARYFYRNVIITILAMIFVFVVSLPQLDAEVGFCKKLQVGRSKCVDLELWVRGHQQHYLPKYVLG